jgi:formylmethanofuran dehydrogenase subunit A
MKLEIQNKYNTLFIIIKPESMYERHQVRQIVDWDNKIQGVSEHKGLICFGTEGGIGIYIKNFKKIKKENKWKKIYKYLSSHLPFVRKTGCDSIIR